EVRKAWDSYKAANIGITSSQQSLARRMAISTGTPPDPLNIRRPATGRLSLSDVAYLWGGEFAVPDNLVKSMIDPDVGTIQQRVDFIRQHLAKASQTAGGEAAEYGFNPEALGEVYDGIMRSLSLDPSDIDYFTPALEMFRGIRSDMQAIFAANAISDDALDIINAWIRENHANALRTGLYNKTPSIDLIPNAITKEDGSPLILYHGSTSKQLAEKGVDVTKGGGFLGEGFYMDTEVAVANEFSGVGEIIQEVVADTTRSIPGANVTPVVLAPKNLVHAEDGLVLELANSMIMDAGKHSNDAITQFMANILDDSAFDIAAGARSQAEIRDVGKTAISILRSSTRKWLKLSENAV
ncbi:hypothetical protein LCGC14_3056930, partial [marine sediment metagenome]